MKFREKVRAVTAALAALTFASTSGCANRFAEYYVPVETASMRTLEASGERAKPELIRSVDAAADSRRLSTSGFELIGSSNFESPALYNSGAEALTHARHIGADLVVLQETLTGTKTLNVAIEYPQTPSERQQCSSIPGKGVYTLLGTPYLDGCSRRITPVPIRVESKNYCATFWRKLLIASAGQQCSSDGPASSASRAMHPITGNSQSTCNNPH